MKCGDLGSALAIFNCMNKDSVSWNIMIYGYLQKGDLQEGFLRFMSARADGFEPNTSTLVLVIQACHSLRAELEGLQVHGYIFRSGFLAIPSVQNSSPSLYADFDMVNAQKMFDEMCEKDVISWSVIISGYVQNEEAQVGLQVHREMAFEVGIEPDGVTMPFHCKSVHCVIIWWGYESNELVLNSLIDAYGKCNLIELAWELFDGMERRDVVSWSTMIAGFTYCGKPDEAIAVFQEMIYAQEKLNVVTIINLLEACSASAELRRSMWAHGISIYRGLEAEVAVATAIVEMQSKCGAIEDSRKAFEQISDKNVLGEEIRN
ncbi:pentatricopeptide repeat-containing protein [Quercus suber]|uniref:Pentatricopeptide repeat-containing protein n=1 Tax=Quercus suber TaxID=58331 RepID=A0AAW0LJY3_QUESU